MENIKFNSQFCVEIKCQLDATEVLIADLKPLLHLVGIFFHILTMMHGQNHIKSVLCLLVAKFFVLFSILVLFSTQ